MAEKPELFERAIDIGGVRSRLVALRFVAEAPQFKFDGLIYKGVSAEGVVLLTTLIMGVEPLLLRPSEQLASKLIQTPHMTNSRALVHFFMCNPCPFLKKDAAPISVVVLLGFSIPLPNQALPPELLNIGNIAGYCSAALTADDRRKKWMQLLRRQSRKRAREVEHEGEGTVGVEEVSCIGLEM